MPEYLVRASLEFIRDFEQASRGIKPAILLATSKSGTL